MAGRIVQTGNEASYKLSCVVMALLWRRECMRSVQTGNEPSDKCELRHRTNVRSRTCSEHGILYARGIGEKTARLRWEPSSNTRGVQEEDSMSQARSRFPLHGLLSRWSKHEVARLARGDHSTSRPRERFRTERLLRWYLLVWVGLVSILGFSELLNQTVPGGWTACLTAQVKPKWCELFKMYLSQGTSPLPDLA